MCHTCPVSKIRYFENTLKDTDFELVKKLSNKLNNNGNKRKLALRGPLLFMDNEMEFCFNSLDQTFTRDYMHYIVTHCGVSVGHFLPLYRLLNVSMTIANNLQTSEEKLRARWWFNIGLGEAVFFQLPNEFAKTRGLYLFVRSSAIKTFVCLDPDDLRKFNFLLFGVVEPDVWVLIVTSAFLCAFIFKSLKQGVNLVLAFAAFPVNPQKRKHVVCFLVWANFVAWFWQSNLSVDIMSLQEIPDFWILIEKHWRTWINTPNFGNGIQTVGSFFGQNFWHGKTKDEVIYDESVDPIPWNDVRGIVEKLKSDKLTVFTFLHSA